MICGNYIVYTCTRISINYRFAFAPRIYKMTTIRSSRKLFHPAIAVFTLNSWKFSSFVRWYEENLLRLALPSPSDEKFNPVYACESVLLRNKANEKVTLTWYESLALAKRTAQPMSRVWLQRQQHVSLVLFQNTSDPVLLDVMEYLIHSGATLSNFFFWPRPRRRVLNTSDTRPS